MLSKDGRERAIENGNRELLKASFLTGPVARYDGAKASAHERQQVLKSFEPCYPGNSIEAFGYISH